ncbi:hypothetical protein GALL_479190 [mine drainage metagenome]|uniref:Uncharacterized protein n=1 Tax=mine drainage metagenome TaxID=410659 RepID=A0A1J5Q3M1_9ZZZZ
MPGREAQGVAVLGKGFGREAAAGLGLGEGVFENTATGILRRQVLRGVQIHLAIGADKRRVQPRTVAGGVVEFGQIQDLAIQRRHHGVHEHGGNGVGVVGDPEIAVVLGAVAHVLHGGHRLGLRLLRREFAGLCLAVVVVDDAGRRLRGIAQHEDAFVEDGRAQPVDVQQGHGRHAGDEQRREQEQAAADIERETGLWAHDVSRERGIFCFLRRQLDTHRACAPAVRVLDCDTEKATLKETPGRPQFR